MTPFSVMPVPAFAEVIMPERPATPFSSRDLRPQPRISAPPRTVVPPGGIALPMFSTFIHPGAQQRVAAVLASTFLSEGKLVHEFEARLSAELGLQHPAALNSGTSALHLALEVAGVGPGDEVILAPQTFIASALAVAMARL